MSDTFSTQFDVAVHEDTQGCWVVEAIATIDTDSPIRQVRFKGQDARNRAHIYAARKYGLKTAA